MTGVQTCALPISRETSGAKPARLSEKQSPHYDYTSEKKTRAPELSVVPVQDPEPEQPRVSVKKELTQKEKEREERLRQEKEKLGLKVELQDNVSARNVIAESASHISTLDEYAGSTRKAQQKEKQAKKAANNIKRVTAKSLLSMEGGIGSAIVLAEILGKPRSMRDN